MCILIYMYIYISCTYKAKFMYIFIYTHIYLCTNIHIYLFMCAFVRFCVCVYDRVRVCVFQRAPQLRCRKIFVCQKAQYILNISEKSPVYSRSDAGIARYARCAVARGLRERGGFGCVEPGW